MTKTKNDDEARVRYEQAFRRVLGRLLRDAREARGLTRIELCERLPSGIGDRTLLAYEHGIRGLDVPRLYEICTALGVSASELLAAAEEKMRAPADLPIYVNLDALANAEVTDQSFDRIRLWAERRRMLNSDLPRVLMQPNVTRELAIALDFAPGVLASYFLAYSHQLSISDG